MNRRGKTSSLRVHLMQGTAVLSALGIGVIACAEDAANPTFFDDVGVDAGPDVATDTGANTNADDAGAGADADVFVPDSGPVDPRGPFDPANEAVACVAGSPCATELVAGEKHFCARMSDGTVRCWGADFLGSLGGAADNATVDGGTIKVGTVVGLGSVEQLSAAGSTTCARLTDGGVQCWGDNRTGQLGLAVDPAVADEDWHPTPGSVALDQAATRVDVGHGTVCAVLSSAELVCWGKDTRAQLGLSDAPAGGRNPVRGPGRLAIAPLALTRTSAGSTTVLGLNSAGEVWTWGGVSGNDGLLAGRVATITPDSSPTRVDTLTKVTSFAASVSFYPDPTVGPGDDTPLAPPNTHACAIADGEVSCWGRSPAGALCTGLPDPETVPRKAPFSAKTWPQQLAVGDEITCARTTDGNVYCCGSDTRGRLGTGTAGTGASILTKASAFTHRAVRVATSDYSVCVLVKDGSVECWGSNENGELGKTPDTQAHPTPSKIVF
jgi:alpha-tubulin suppressor-like RCC1 family protein